MINQQRPTRAAGYHRPRDRKTQTVQLLVGPRPVQSSHPFAALNVVQNTSTHMAAGTEYEGCYREYLETGHYRNTTPRSYDSRGMLMSHSRPHDNGIEYRLSITDLLRNVATAHYMMPAPEYRSIAQTQRARG